MGTGAWWPGGSVLSSPLAEPAMLDVRVARARVDRLRFAMEPPLQLAGRSVASREYVVLQVVLENGFTGTGYVLTRGQPIGEAAEALAQRVVGRGLEDLFAVEPGDRGRSAHQRARAIADQCAWDLFGRLAGVPTWELFGPARGRQPVLLVAGYRRAGESDQAMAARLAAWRERGYRWIKIAGELEPDRTGAVLAELRRLVPREDLEVVVDVGFAGADVAQVVDAAKAWEQYGPAWVEDPVPVADAEDISAVRAGSPGRVGAGDEASFDELAGLLRHRAVDVLRADSTTAGGLTGLREIAVRTDVPVSFHIYPEIHRHLALVQPDTSPVERFPAGDPFDFVDRFMHPADWTERDGDLAPPGAPGLGLEYRPEPVRAHVVRSSTYDAD